MMFGLALGDALGAPVEFIPTDDRPQMNSLKDAELCEHSPGIWTDDTSMTLCLLESLVERNSFDPTDQMVRYLKWYEEGYLTPNGSCDDIGKTIKIVLLSFKKYRTIRAKHDESRQGNGSLMRTAAVALYRPIWDDVEMKLAADCSYVTHGSTLAADCCKYWTKLLICALRGSKEDILTTPPDQPCHPDLTHSLTIYQTVELSDLPGTGQVLDTLLLALRSFAETSSFEEGARMAVNHAKDSDTVGAVYGQLAGAFYGLDRFDQSWLETLVNSHVIMDVLDRAWEGLPRSDGAENECNQ